MGTDSRALLGEAIREEGTNGVRICWAHPMPVWFEDRECPCCWLMRENEKNYTGRLVKSPGPSDYARKAS